MSQPRRLISLVVLALAPLAFAAADASVDLVAAQCEIDRLGPDVLSGTAVFEVDEATTIRVEITSTLDDLTTHVVGPAGELIDPATVDSFGGSFVTFDGDTADSSLITPATPGSHYLYAFPSLGVGTYTVHFAADPALAEDVPVITELVTDSPVVTAFAATEPVVPLHLPVGLMAIVLDGTAALGGASATATIRAPSGAETVLVLLDDGAAGDGAAGDGIYSGSFTATETGVHDAVAEITGTNGLGTPFTRHGGAELDIVPTRATLEGTWGDQGVDDNANGLFDRLVVSADVDVLVAGDFRLNLTLRTAGGATLPGQGTATLPLGAGTIPVDFDAEEIRGTGEDGPYVIETAELLYLGVDEVEPSDWITEGNWQTQGYLLSEFERPAIELTGVNVDAGVDPDTDGDFDQLVVRAGIRVDTPGSYEYAARLADPCGAPIDFVAGQQSFPSGADPEELVLAFDGAAIGSHGVDGPYAVRDLIVFGPGGSLVASEVTETQAYAGAQFEGFAGPPDCDGDGNADLCQVLAGQDPDCNVNFHPDVCDLADATSTDCDNNLVPDECQADCNANAMPDACELLGGTYAVDDGTNEQSIGAGGGDFIWLNQFTVLPGAETIDGLSVAWGIGVPDGTSTTLVLYDDPNNDGNPADATVLASALVTSGNPGTDILTTAPITPTLVGNAGDSFFAAAYITYPDTAFPASQDTGSPPLGRSWFVPGAAGTLDINDLSSTPPARVDQAGFPGNWLLRAESQGSPLDCNVNGVPDECDLTSGTSPDLNANGTPDECEGAQSAGAVPDGDDLPGAPLLASRAPNGQIDLQWGASCLAGDVDYEIYEGTIGDFSSHRPVTCSTGGATMATVMTGNGDHYYLVVPRSLSREGSYGVDHDGTERPQGAAACLPQSIAACGS